MKRVPLSDNPLLEPAPTPAALPAGAASILRTLAADPPRFPSDARAKLEQTFPQTPLGTVGPCANVWHTVLGSGAGQCAYGYLLYTRPGDELGARMTLSNRFPELPGWAKDGAVLLFCALHLGNKIDFAAERREAERDATGIGPRPYPSQYMRTT